MKHFLVDKDAWSNGQIQSKLWLCSELEKMHQLNKLHLMKYKIAIVGGWYGILSFLLLTRNNFPIDYIRSFDIDPSCEPIADMINENWLIDNWKFKAITKDANDIDFDEFDLIINTSTEHFEEKIWFDNLKNKTVILQGNNLNDDHHHSKFSSLNDFDLFFPVNKKKYLNKISFKYHDKEFDRYMKIGIV